MPLYCVAISCNAVYAANDIRFTGGGHVNYAIDLAVQPLDRSVQRLGDFGYSFTMVHRDATGALTPLRIYP
jgi:hypothetical protein